MQIIQNNALDNKAIPVTTVVNDVIEVLEVLKSIGGTNACPTITLSGSYNRGEEVVRGTVFLTPRNLWIISKACYPMILAGVARGGFQSPELRTALDGISQIQRAAKVALSNDRWPTFDIDGLDALKATIKGLITQLPQQPTAAMMPKK